MTITAGLADAAVRGTLQLSDNSLDADRKRCAGPGHTGAQRKVMGMNMKTSSLLSSALAAPLDAQESDEDTETYFAEQFSARDCKAPARRAP